MRDDSIRLAFGGFFMCVATIAAAKLGFSLFFQMMHFHPISGGAAAVSFIIMVACTILCVAIMRK